MLAAVIAVVVLLREILLPFVAGMVLAYLLDPLANRLERLGMNRLIATLAIMGLFVAGVAALIVADGPDHRPRACLFHRKVSDATSGGCRRSPPIRAGRGCARSSAKAWATRSGRSASSRRWRPAGSAHFLRSVWSGGRALISVFSLAVVTPIVACYLIYDWNRMIAAVDNWVPPAQPRHRAGARARDRRHDRRLRARPERAVSRPRACSTPRRWR